MNGGALAQVLEAVKPCLRTHMPTNLPPGTGPQGAAGRRRRGQPAADGAGPAGPGFRCHRGGQRRAGAAASCEGCTPDVIVLDAIMPGLDGFETCRRARRMPGFEKVPVLMLTGLEDEASITRAFEAGATDFFVKATQWALLAGRLRYLLRAARTRQRARAQQVAAGASAGPRPHGQLRLAARSGDAAGSVSARPARVRPRAPRPGRHCGRCCA